MKGKGGLEVLEDFLPQGSLDKITPILNTYSVFIKIKSARQTKLGDYRPLQNANWEHQITLNNDLNPYAFLITLLHEIAHMQAYSRYKRKVKPHGNEWKELYCKLLAPYLETEIFPPSLKHTVKEHLDSPTASSCTDHRLYMELKKYDSVNHSLVFLETLSEGTNFKWRNGLTYRKEARLRKRFRCIESKSKKIYLFHPMAEVERLDF